MAVVEKIDRVKDLKAMLKQEGINLPRETDWNELVQHVEVHKYLINQQIGWTISWADAVFSWYENVFVPIKRAVQAWEIRGAFQEMTLGQLYLAVCTHWHFLKQRNPLVTPEDAAHDFAAHYGHGLAAWFSRFLQPGVA